MTALAIESHGLTKRFGAVTALDQLSFQVQQGSITGFLGPNGAGKTTALRILAGLSSATAGEARVLGQRVSRDGLAVRRLIGFLPEEPAFYGWMTAAETLEFVAEVMGLKGSAMKRRRDELLELMGLENVARRRVVGFSRGMRQRLGIAQAMVSEPPLLLLDEPCSALDPVGRRDVLDLIASLRGSSTVFLSTHILSDVERVCDQVVVIVSGRTVVEASVQDLRERVAPPVAEVELEGDPAPLIAALRQSPWVQRVEQVLAGNDLIVRVWPTDADAARRALPQVVADSGIVPHRYEWMTPDLEEVFLDLVQPGGRS